MVFNSTSFLIYFPIVVLLYYLLPKRFQKEWLVVASYYFYMSWSVKYALLLLFVTLSTYVGARLIEDGKHKKSWFGASIVCTMGILGFFKYANFFWDNLALFLGKMGIGVGVHTFSILLPVGISFYTFQALGYIIDVYRREIPAEKNLLKYMLFIAFFPQLLAGPIARTGNLLNQIQHNDDKAKPDIKKIGNGLVYMLYGFFLKLVLTDNLMVYVDEVFNHYRYYGSVELLLGAVGFGLQIYGDFSSYSIIAVGAAEAFGFQLIENFESPYFACSIQEFWRRWHISLSTWFRDYVYFPLGGSRCSKLKSYRNLMVTFLVSGLWHGADWSFVLWGGIHGVYQIIGKEIKGLKQRIYTGVGINVNGICYKIGQIITTFVLVDFAWIFFRADSIQDAFMYIKFMLTRKDFWVLTDGSLNSVGFANPTQGICVLIALLVLFLTDAIRYRQHLRIDSFLLSQGQLIRILGIVFFIVSIAVVGQYGGGYDESAFIYFQF